jgi:hypothetical protein
VVLPVVVAAGYFALWACAVVPAATRPVAPPPVGNTGEWGFGAIAGQHYKNPPGAGEISTSPTWGGGGQLWLSHRGSRFDVGGALKGGSFGLGPSFTLRFWPVIAERFRLGIGGELGLVCGMAEIPFGFAVTERFWVYAAPRVQALPNAVSVPAGLSLRIASHTTLMLEGGGIVYAFAPSDSLNDLGMRYYGAAGMAFAF